MNRSDREARLVKTFVKLADTLTDEYDLVDLLDMLVAECVALLDADAGGLMLADPTTSNLELIVSTTEAAEFVEINQLNAGDGPCIECYRTGSPITVANIHDELERWPTFSSGALEHGYQSMHAFPLRLRGTTIGAMNLFSTTTGALPAEDILLGQSLADVATIGILQERHSSDQTVLAEQLQRALNSRVVIEQAKGIVAHSANLDMGQSFNAIRDYARNHNRKLSDIATAIVNQEIDITVGTFTKR